MSCRKDKLGRQFIPDIHPPGSTTIVHDTELMEVKEEEVDFDFDHTSASSYAASDFELTTVSSIQYVDCGSAKAQEKGFKELYADLVHIDQDCEICLKYMRMLSKHVRITHARSQSMQDPLLIDSLDIDPALPHAEQSSYVEIKCEVHENTVKMDNSDLNVESDPDYELESESDSNCTASPHLAKIQESSDSAKTRKNILPLKCNVCGKSYRCQFYLDSHMRIHTRETTNAVQVQKKTIETGGKTFKCRGCEERFSDAISLIEHYRTHTGEKPFKCNICQKSFALKSNLTVHKTNHTGERPYKCDQCEKSYTRSSYLIEHKKNHIRAKPFKCDMCEERFKTSIGLTEHKGKHTGGKPFKCEECGEKFSKASDWIEHKIIHAEAEDKPFKCDKCRQSFAAESNLTVHKMSHSAVRIHKCDVCEKSFERSACLAEHKRIHTGEFRNSSSETGVRRVNQNSLM